MLKGCRVQGDQEAEGDCEWAEKGLAWRALTSESGSLAHSASNHRVQEAD